MMVDVLYKLGINTLNKIATINIFLITVKHTIVQLLLF